MTILAFTRTRVGGAVITLEDLSVVSNGRLSDAINCVWAPLVALGDTGTPLDFAQFDNRTVQVEGTFAAGTVVIEGSLDGVNYHTLTDNTGAALSFTASGFKRINEMTNFIRPHLTVGTASAIVVTILARASIRQV